MNKQQPCPYCNQLNPPTVHNGPFYQCRRCQTIYRHDYETPPPPITTQKNEPLCECGAVATAFTLVYTRTLTKTGELSNYAKGRIGPLLLCNNCADLEREMNPNGHVWPIDELAQRQRRIAEQRQAINQLIKKVKAEHNGR